MGFLIREGGEFFDNFQFDRKLLMAVTFSKQILRLRLVTCPSFLFVILIFVCDCIACIARPHVGVFLLFRDYPLSQVVILCPRLGAE